MLEQTIFQSLSPAELKERTDSIEIAYQLIAVTLIYGDKLIGCLAKHWAWDGQTVSVGFNTAKGERYGHSHCTQVAISLIADIQPIPLSEESIPRVPEGDSSLAFLRELGIEDEKFARLMVQDYPNPLASIICEHNLKVAAKHDLPILEYVEKALPTEAIPPEGIKLDEDFLLYADWEFFSRQMAGDATLRTNIPVVGISKNLNPSLQAEVFRRLRNTWMSKSLRKGVISSSVKEYWIQGCIFVPETPEETDIEGEKYVLAFCVSSGTDKEYPVLLKLKSLRYPLEFLGHIVSVLAFYGELAPIPLTVLGQTYQNTLLARAIGYFHS